MERGIDHKEVSIEDWRAAGKYLRQATVEVAQSMGGQDLAMGTIDLAGDSDQILPSPESLQFLETNFPGAAEAIISRAERIQKESFRKDRNFISRIFRRR